MSEKVFYGGDTKFSYTACQWIEAQSIETGKYIHYKICGHGGERMAKAWVLNDKGKKKHLCIFWLMDMNLKLTQCINFMDIIGMGIHGQRIVQKDNKRDIKICVRLIGL